MAVHITILPLFSWSVLFSFVKVRIQLKFTKTFAIELRTLLHDSSEFKPTSQSAYLLPINRLTGRKAYYYMVSSPYT